MTIGRRSGSQFIEVLIPDAKSGDISAVGGLIDLDAPRGQRRKGRAEARTFPTCCTRLPERLLPSQRGQREGCSHTPSGAHTRLQSRRANIRRILSRFGP